MSTSPSGPSLAGAAFLLAQLGAHASEQYARRTIELGLTPAHTGLLRLVTIQPGMNQQTLSGLLGVTPSKVVALVDDLEARGLLERRRSDTDRRATALHLTDAGQDTMAGVRKIAMEHEATITAALSESERLRLIGLLQQVADEQGLTPGVHPGYRRLR